MTQPASAARCFRFFCCGVFCRVCFSCLVFFCVVFFDLVMNIPHSNLPCPTQQQQQQRAVDASLEESESESQNRIPLPMIHKQNDKGNEKKQKCGQNARKASRSRPEQWSPARSKRRNAKHNSSSSQHTCKSYLNAASHIAESTPSVAKRIFLNAAVTSGKPSVTNLANIIKPSLLAGGLRLLPKWKLTSSIRSC